MFCATEGNKYYQEKNLQIPRITSTAIKITPSSNIFLTNTGNRTQTLSMSRVWKRQRWLIDVFVEGPQFGQGTDTVLSYRAPEFGTQSW